MASSTGGSYDSDGSDSLICGFGPRRGRRDSVDSGDYQSGCDDDSRRSGIDLELTESQANLICGFGGDRNGDKKTDKKGFDKSDFAVAAFEETQSEDGAAQTMGADDVEDKKTDTDHHAIHPDGGNNGHQADASIASGASHDRGNKSRLRDHGGNQIVSTFLPMELKVNAPSSSARTNRDDGSLSRSLKSVDSMDMSMASEDAIVLMYNSLDDESSDEDGEDNRAKRLKRNENIVGRVYRGQTDDYGSIPLELEIESEISAPSDSSFTSKQSTRSVSAPVQGHRASNGTNGEGTAVNAINGDREKIRPVPPTKVEDVAEESESKTKSFRPFSSQSAQNSNVNSPSEKQDCIPQSESNKNFGKMDMLVPTKPPALNIKERKKETLNDAVPNNSNSNYAIGFPSTAPTPRDKISRINSLRKSTLDEDNLSIIEENDCDSSTGTSIMQSNYSEAGDDDSDASGSTSKDDDLVLDSLFSRASKSKAPKPMGEHAKSMAKKLGVPMRQLRKFLFVTVFVKLPSHFQ